jgi:hypothetical protein
MGMHLDRLAEYLAIPSEQMEGLVAGCGIQRDRLQTRRLERTDVKQLHRWIQDNLEVVRRTCELTSSDNLEFQGLLDRLASLVNAKVVFDSTTELTVNAPKQIPTREPWRVPTATDMQRAKHAAPKPAFSLFVAPGGAGAPEVARLLGEIAELQRMLGGQGIEFRLAGVRSTRHEGKLR